MCKLLYTNRNPSQFSLVFSYHNANKNSHNLSWTILICIQTDRTSCATAMTSPENLCMNLGLLCCKKIIDFTRPDSLASVCRPHGPKYVLTRNNVESIVSSLKWKPFLWIQKIMAHHLLSSWNHEPLSLSKEGTDINVESSTYPI